VRVKRQDDAKFNAAKCKNNAKNTAKILQNNAGACGSRVESGAGEVLIFKELRPEIDREWKFEKIIPCAS
jgi:hypothetical protein